MGDSLKDQLVALGLAREQKPGTRRKKSAPSRRSAGRAGKGQAGAEPSLQQAYNLRRQAERDDSAHKKNEKQALDRQRRETNARIAALISGQSLNDPKAELKRNFLYKGRIRSVLVTRPQLKDLNAGKLGLVFLKGRYHLLSPELTESVRALSPDHIPDLSAAVSDEDEGDFPVPDDLVW